ncbi:hypothetical protein C2G38_2154585 [Gigaspora rosea]|uniref:BACK domain-containing protein n=1 Tax=Gigaspora rosea TaxID=44941 RepID=A0A397W6P8_9GLOM|nr:hypothetical protein C2G38_2154585 [Gigaspora rosea]
MKFFCVSNNVFYRYIYSGIIFLENLDASSILDLLIIVNEINLAELVMIIQSYLINKKELWLYPNFLPRLLSLIIFPTTRRCFEFSFKTRRFAIEETEFWDKATLRNCMPHIRYFQISKEDVWNKIKPYQRILEKNLWDDIISRFMKPNMLITSPFLPPRKNLSIAKFESIIRPPSSIITLQHAAEISS